MRERQAPITSRTVVLLALKKARTSQETLVRKLLLTTIKLVRRSRYK